MPVSSQSNKTCRKYIASGLAGTMLLFAGCATTPMPPTASLNEAKIAIRAAESDGASHYAAAELDQARRKLKQADQAVVSEDMKLAEQLAVESTVAAQLAVARTEAIRAETVNDEIIRGTKALKEEMLRTGEQQ